MLGAALAFGCGGKDSPTAPSSAARGALAASADTEGRREATGWSLTLVLRLRETGGVPVTVHSATIALIDVNGAVQSQQTVEKPLGGTNRLAPTQELMTPAVTFESADGSPYPLSVRVTVQYTDDNGQPGTAQGTVIAQGLPPLVTVFGIVYSGPNGVPIPGATVQIANGPHDGRVVTTDGNGYYSLGQVSGKMTLFVQAIGHVGIWVDVDATHDTRLDIAMFGPRRFQP